MIYSLRAVSRDAVTKRSFLLFFIFIFYLFIYHVSHLEGSISGCRDQEKWGFVGEEAHCHGLTVCVSDDDFPLSCLGF
jgi:hypothetical protein